MPFLFRFFVLIVSFLVLAVTGCVAFFELAILYDEIQRVNYEKDQLEKGP